MSEAPIDRESVERLAQEFHDCDELPITLMSLRDRIEELEAESERLRLALEETVSLLWDDMSKQESVGKHGGYIYMKCRAALAEPTGGEDE